MAGDSRTLLEPRSRREILLGGVAGLSAAAVAPATAVFPGASRFDPNPDRILVVVELAGGNDGLDTVTPYSDDAYHRARPTLRAATRLGPRLDHERALHPALQGLRRLWSDGRLAIVEGCGHPGASRSHFGAMAMWHTATARPGVELAPGGLGRAELGWLGRLADDAWSDAAPATFVNVAATLSPALRSRRHSTILVSDPERAVRFRRSGARVAGARPGDAAAPAAIAERVRAEVLGYRPLVEYGPGALGAALRAVAALVTAGFGFRVYYTALGGFDTHAAQSAARPLLLARLGNALDAFHQDLRRARRGGDVATLVFSEFGRRLDENASGGTEHGTAGPVFLIGDGVVPGIHGARPSLTELDAGGDLQPSTDFRRVYASIERDWLGGAPTLWQCDGVEPLRLFT